MAAVELHGADEHGAHENGAQEREGDALAKTVSIMVAVIGVVLAVATIASHRAHTASVLHRTHANDQWAYYQAKKTREYVADAIAGLAGTVSVGDPQKARALNEKLARDRDRYDSDARGIQKDAQEREAASDREEHRALRLDLGEGFLELGLVLSSLYFLSRRRFFPVLGLVAAVIGGLAAASSLLL